MANPLDKYRLAQEETIKIETVEGVPYKAFEVATISQRRLDLRPARDTQRIISYGYLFEVYHAASMFIGIMVSNPLLSIDIQGRNLQGLIDGLREEKVIYIQEFVPEYHTKPADGEPIITTFKVVKPGGSTERPAKPKH